ncbi:MAG: signal peptidase I [Clostridia bacterium]|nr:signal peptidase I [Clostridia bacterium]
MTVTTGVNKKTKKEKKKKTVLQEIVGFVFDLLVVFALFMVITTFVAEPVWVKGTSMTNTLQNNELLLVSKRAYGEGTKGMERGDIVICRYPGRTDFAIPLGANLSITRHTAFVKRLVALPGDTIEFSGGNMYVNGELVPNPEKMGSIPYDYPLRQLGANEYFVVGDNRRTSHDSRASDVGPISRDMIVGKAVRVIFPFSAWRKVQ